MGIKDNFLQKGLSKDQHHGIEKRQNFIFNSVNGTLLSPTPGDKSKFSVNFTNTINFPEDASSIQIGLHSANIVNNVQNITDTLYNTISFIVDTVPQTLTLPPGSYSACDIQTTINSLLATAYQGVTPVPEIKLIANTATQKFSIQFVRAGMQIDWAASTIGFILGFDTQTTQPAAPSTANEIIEGDTEARLNWAITNFLITCPELVGDGLPLNNVGFGIVGGVPIVAAPGSLIAYEAVNPLYIQCDYLVGQNISSLTFQLTNERVEPIVMTEDYNFVVVIKILY
jgi:hypothetical protein